VLLREIRYAVRSLAHSKGVAIVGIPCLGLGIFAVPTLEAWRRNEFWEFGFDGVLAYSVSQRTREIGIRVTLGAGKREVMSLVVGQGLTLTLTGVAIGLVLAAFGTPLTRALLYQVSPFDPVSFIAVSMLLLAVALIASDVPARRAMKVDPVVALQQE
jgi:ABC-type lipoprotein release transport system permease subunit